MRHDKADGFYGELVSGILNDDYGLLTHAATDILEDFDQTADYEN